MYSFGNENTLIQGNEKSLLKFVAVSGKMLKTGKRLSKKKKLHRDICV